MALAHLRRLAPTGTVGLVAALLSTAVAVPAVACSCVDSAAMPLDVQVARSVRSQDAVFAGVVASIADDARKDDAWRVRGSARWHGSRPLVLSVGEPDRGPLVVTLRVSKVWKGDVSARVVVRTNRQSAACGYRFEPDREYLVYAARHKDQLYVSRCSRTRLLVAATNESDVLDDLTANGTRLPPPSAGVWLPPKP